MRPYRYPIRRGAIHGARIDVRAKRDDFPASIDLCLLLTLKHQLISLAGCRIKTVSIHIKLL